MSEQQHRGTWGGREDGMWWQGSLAADQQQTLHQQHLLHQQQQLAAAQQQQAIQDARSTASSINQPHFSYKMASSFQNPATTVSNVSSTSPIGAAGIRGYDYRLGGGNPAMSNPVTAAQWWYPSAMDNSMQNSIASMQNSIACTMQNSLQGMHQSIQTSASSQQQSQQQQQAQLVQQQQQEAETHRQHQEAHRQHQEAQRQHQEVQRQQEAHRQHQEVQQAIQNHNQAIAEAQARQHQNNHLQQQIQTSQHQAVLQQQHLTVQAPIAAKGRMPRGKGDARPKGRMTAYAFFVQTCREEHKKKHPEENVVFTEFTKKCAERWKTMLDKEKKRFHEMAEKDKKRYDAEMQNYTPPKGEKTRGKKRKQTKDPNAPKRSLSAFFWFCNDERGKVKGANPEYGVGDIAKELGRRWSDADPETKSKYEAMAEKDKARYEKEMTAYKKKNNPSMQAPVPEPEEEEEAEDDVDDDDDE